jgi:hypothetical protein
MSRSAMQTLINVLVDVCVRELKSGRDADKRRDPENTAKEALLDEILPRTPETKSAT